MTPSSTDDPLVSDPILMLPFLHWWPQVSDTILMTPFLHWLLSSVWPHIDVPLPPLMTPWYLTPYWCPPSSTDDLWYLTPYFMPPFLHWWLPGIWPHIDAPLLPLMTPGIWPHIDDPFLHWWPQVSDPYWWPSSFTDDPSGLFYWHCLTLIPAWISNYIHCKGNYLFIPKLQRCNHWSLGMDK